jgi:hypothetical protein
MTQTKRKKRVALKFAKPRDDAQSQARSISKIRRDARRPAGDRGGNGREVPAELTDEQGNSQMNQSTLSSGKSRRGGDAARRKRRTAVNLKLFRKPRARHDLLLILKEALDPRTGATKSGFPTRARMRSEIRTRIKSLTAWKNSSQKGPIKPANLPVRRAKRMLRKLRAEILVSSFASPRFTRQYRRRFCGVVLEAIERIPAETIYLYTIVPASWRVDGTTLHTKDPKGLLRQFRTQLNRAGLSALGGWLITFVHGDYDKTYDIFQLHLHVLVVGDKVHALERLRELRIYKPSAHVKRPIVKKRLKDPARQISYHLAQDFWPSKPTVFVKDVSVRVRERRRIPEPRHAEVLMWLDRQRFADLVWLHGCRITGKRLVAQVQTARETPGQLFSKATR